MSESVLPMFSSGSFIVSGKILQARLQQYVNRELPDVQANFPKGAPSFVLLISANGMATCAGFPLLAPLAPAPPSLPSSGSWEADLCRLITQVPLFLAADWVHLRGRIPSRTKGGRREVRCYSPAQFLSSSGPVSPHPPLHSPGQALALSFLPVALQAWRC